MKRNRVLAGLFLVVVLTLALATPVFAVEFTDVEDTDYEPGITALAYRDFIGGYSDGEFKPDNLLQRQQFAKMAVLTMGYEVTTADVSTFLDTPAPYDPINNPLYPGSYVAVAAANQIMIGRDGNVFDFGGLVTRQQVITVVVRAAGDALEAPPADWVGVLPDDNPWHGDNIRKAEYNRLLVGIPDLNTWDPTDYATRGEAAELLAQLFYRTGKILTLEGPAFSQDFTMAELQALGDTVGYGGWKNKLGNITGPKEYEGISIAALMTLAGGSTKVVALAADGYKITYDGGKIEGKLPLYDPSTGETLFDPAVDTDIPAEIGTVTMIVAYECEDELLLPDEAPLRIGFVSDAANQVSHSGSWAKQLVKITVE